MHLIASSHAGPAAMYMNNSNGTRASNMGSTTIALKTPTLVGGGGGGRGAVETPGGSKSVALAVESDLVVLEF